MNQTESKIYVKYRHYLTSENRHGTHAAERRQNARAKVVAEFSIPFAEVKRIVAAGDVLNGIEHVKPVEVDPAGGLVIERKLVSQLRVGDRVKYLAIFDTDARVIAIDGYKVTMRGLSSHTNVGKAKGTFTYDLSPDRWDGQQMTLPVVVNRGRRVLASS